MKHFLILLLFGLCAATAFANPIDGIYNSKTSNSEIDVEPSSTDYVHRRGGSSPRLLGYERIAQYISNQPIRVPEHIQGYAYQPASRIESSFDNRNDAEKQSNDGGHGTQDDYLDEVDKSVDEIDRETGKFPEKGTEKVNTGTKDRLDFGTDNVFHESRHVGETYEIGDGEKISQKEKADKVEWIDGINNQQGTEKHGGNYRALKEVEQSQQDSSDAEYDESGNREKIRKTDKFSGFKKASGTAYGKIRPKEEAGKDEKDDLKGFKSMVDKVEWIEGVNNQHGIEKHGGNYRALKEVEQLQEDSSDNHAEHDTSGHREKTGSTKKLPEFKKASETVHEKISQKEEAGEGEKDDLKAFKSMVDKVEWIEGVNNQRGIEKHGGNYRALKEVEQSQEGSSDNVAELDESDHREKTRNTKQYSGLKRVSGTVRENSDFKKDLDSYDGSDDTDSLLKNGEIASGRTSKYRDYAQGAASKKSYDESEKGDEEQNEE